MSTTRSAIAIRVGSIVLAGAFAAQPAAAAMFPVNPTVNDDVYAVLKYPCPYPVPSIPPVLIRNNGELLLEVTTAGTVCFSDAMIDKDYAFNLGKLAPGTYNVTVRHRYTLGNGQPSETYWSNPVSRKFTVVDGISERLSGVWASTTRSRDGINITLLDPQTAFVVWNTNDPEGRPIWLYGTLKSAGRNVVAGTMSFNRDLRFGDTRPAGGISDSTWGTLRLELIGCGALKSSWTSELPGYGAGSDSLGLLANPRGVDGCLPDAEIPYGTVPVGGTGN